MGQGGIQAPAVPLRTRLLVGEDPTRITAGRLQGIDLQVEVLLGL
jgi:hypothetical protein